MKHMVTVNMSSSFDGATLVESFNKIAKDLGGGMIGGGHDMSGCRSDLDYTFPTKDKACLAVLAFKGFVSDLNTSFEIGDPTPY